MISPATMDLAGEAILIVEDEFMLADELATEFRRRGATVIGPAPTVAAALALIESAKRIDAAVLDIKLRGELSYPIADKLKALQIPFVFATGYSTPLPSAYNDATRLEKPVRPGVVAKTIVDTLNQNWLLAGLSAAEMQAVRPLVELVEWKRGDTLLEADQPIDHVFFPARGIVSIVATWATGERVEVGVIGREGMVGLPILFGHDSMLFDAVCQLPLRGYRASAQAFDTMLQNTELRSKVLQFAGTFMTQIGGTAAANAVCTIEQRLARWLLIAHDRADSDVLELTHEYLSVMLSVRRAGVTLATQVLERSGAIEALRGRIVVRSRAMLGFISSGSYGPHETQYKMLAPSNRST